jgi:hypothetical protein
MHSFASMCVKDRGAALYDTLEGTDEVVRWLSELPGERRVAIRVLNVTITDRATWELVPRMMGRIHRVDHLTLVTQDHIEGDALVIPTRLFDAMQSMVLFNGKLPTSKHRLVDVIAGPGDLVDAPYLEHIEIGGTFRADFRNVRTTTLRKVASANLGWFFVPNMSSGHIHLAAFMYGTTLTNFPSGIDSIGHLLLGGYPESSILEAFASRFQKVRVEYLQVRTIKNAPPPARIPSWIPALFPSTRVVEIPMPSSVVDIDMLVRMRHVECIILHSMKSVRKTRCNDAWAHASVDAVACDGDNGVAILRIAGSDPRTFSRLLRIRSTIGPAFAPKEIVFVCRSGGDPMRGTFSFVPTVKAIRVIGVPPNIIYPGFGPWTSGELEGVVSSISLSSIEE